MLRSCNTVALVVACCLAASAFARPSPICYRLNPKCTPSERPGGANCPAGEKPWLLKDNAPPHCKGEHGSLSKAASAAVREHLLARGEFPDMLSVSDDIKVSFFSFPNKQQVGKLFSLKAKIKDKQGTSMQGKAVELLVLAGGRVVPILRQWEGDDMSVRGPEIRGVWKGSAVTFSPLFLTRDLPQDSQLVVVAHDEQGGNTFNARAFPFSSKAAKYTLAKASSEIVSEPPQMKWELILNADVPRKTLVSYYVTDNDGSASSTIGFMLTRPTSPSVTIFGKTHRTWGGGCFTLVVGLTKLNFDEDGVMLMDYDIVTAPSATARLLTE